MIPMKEIPFTTVCPPLEVGVVVVLPEMSVEDSVTVAYSNACVCVE